jgi:rare lipoprotein A
MTRVSTIFAAAFSAVLSLSFTQSHARDFTQAGIASIYSYKSSKTANGERITASSLTAAHRSLPFGTKVRVTNRKNGRSVVVRINDRGPFIAGRIIDVTPAGAQALGFAGLTPVTVDVVAD